MRVSKPDSARERNPDLTTLYQSVREASRRLSAPLSDADATVQSMPDASPAKWHLAHTTWFFERMILEQNLPRYRAFDPQFNFLFNSYYESIGARQPRPRRGMLTRPALETVAAYRDHVDRAMASLMQEDLAPAVAELVELGCNHEQQHQELLLTDILHLFEQNPLHPAYKDPGPIAVGETDSSPPSYRKFDGGVVEVGHDGEGFAFDCEGPRHRVLIEPFELADRLVTNAEWMEFVANGGYRTPPLWVSAGWATGQSGGCCAGRSPLILPRRLPTSATTRLTRLRPGPAEGCPVNSSGSMQRLTSRCAGTSSTRDACALRPHNPDRPDCARSTAMCGSGRAAPTRPIRAFGRRKAPLANITASSCAGRSYCAAARA